MTQTPGVVLSIDGAYATLTIDRPAVRNAISLATAGALIEGLGACARTRGVRVIILTGAGDRAFASGADLDELATGVATPEAAMEYDRRVLALYRALRDCPLPVIARVQATAIGGGLLLALACDARIAVDTARFAVPAARLGLMLSPYEHRLLIDAIGAGRARLLLASGQRITAERAADWGLIDASVQSTGLDDSVRALASEMVSGAPRAIAAAKGITVAVQEGGSAEAVAAAHYRSVYRSRDLAEGLAAFRERRAPRFTGD